MNKKILLALLALSSTYGIQAFIGTHDVANFFRPADSAAQLHHVHYTPWSFGSRTEYGSTWKARNSSDKKVNLLKINNNGGESALDMIAEATSAIADKLKTSSGGDIPTLLQSVPRDGVRGVQDITGKFQAWDMTFFGARQFSWNAMPGWFSISGQLPLVYKKVYKIGISDQTKNDNTLSTATYDTLTRNYLTTDFVKNVSNWGNIDLSEWEQFGLGDMVVMLNWNGIFPQKKEGLKEVELGVHVGVSIPTGKSADINKAFSLPMGNDSAWGIPVGLSLGLNFLDIIRTGIDADFLALFDDTRVRRMKTATGQTEFLLLNSGVARKEFGLTWQFHLFLQAHHFFKGLSVSAAYDYAKHDNDRLVPKSNDFDMSIVNSANSLKEWQAHNMLFKVNYDWVRADDIVVQYEFFYKLPVAGKKVFDCQTFGIQSRINF